MEETLSIMIIEDDMILAKEIQHFLEKWGYDTSLVNQFESVLEEFLRKRPHLLLLDVNLPFYDGYYWCQQIRNVSQVPIIFISSRNDDRDKIMAIAGGGDDYIEKPFVLEMLKAKIDALLRRTYQYKVKNRIHLNKDLFFDQISFSLIFQEKEVELTKSEKKIMALLLDARPDTVSREEIMNQLWNTDEFVSDGTLTTLISRLRGKLVSVCGEEIIQTKKGQGYSIP